MNSEQNTNNRKNNRSKWLYCRLRPAYDLTDVLAELLEEQPNMNAIAAELAGVSMVAMERGEYGVDESGDDFGDDCDKFSY